MNNNELITILALYARAALNLLQQAIIHIPNLSTEAILLLHTHCMVPLIALLLKSMEQQQTERRFLEFAAHLESRSRDPNYNRRKRMEQELLSSPRAPSRKRKRTKMDKERGLKCVNEDYWNEDAKWKHLKFQRMFGIDREFAKRLVEICIDASPKFFVPEASIKRIDHEIAAHVKVLNVLKVVRFGTSLNAFEDYFQISAEAVRKAHEEFFHVICNAEELKHQYLRQMTRIDAARVSALHDQIHGVPGMAFSIDCMHVKWKNCPVAYQGSFKNKKDGCCTLVLEAGADHNEWFWHVGFGAPGANNDINIWDRSQLRAKLLDGSWELDVDPLHTFTIGGHQFNAIWFLVDGIYPPIARFVKTISDPLKHEVLYASWQERCRKDVERAFAALQGKWRALARPVEFWDPEHIGDMVTGCVLMHNRMVEQRLEANGGVLDDTGTRVIDQSMYAPEQTAPTVDEVRELVMDSAAREVLLSELSHQDIEATTPEAKERQRVLLQEHATKIALKRWDDLADEDRFFKLQRAITKHLRQNKSQQTANIIE